MKLKPEWFCNVAGQFSILNLLSQIYWRWVKWAAGGWSTLYDFTSCTGVCVGNSKSPGSGQRGAGGKLHSESSLLLSLGRLKKLKNSPKNRLTHAGIHLDTLRVNDMQQYTGRRHPGGKSRPRQASSKVNIG